MRRRTYLAGGASVLAGIAVSGFVSRPPSNERLLEAAREYPMPAKGVRTRRRSFREPTTRRHCTRSTRERRADRDGLRRRPRRRTGGIEAAREISDWRPDAGTLVVVPETNRVAVENNERRGVDGDLNRQFPADREPQSELAAGIWDAVEAHQPDVVLDLHRSLGIYSLHREFVGQAIFHSPDARGERLADRPQRGCRPVVFAVPQIHGRKDLPHRAVALPARRARTRGERLPLRDHRVPARSLHDG